ncbi:MAG: hypothetical protein QME79_03700 [Bacillota bacterium]|nr:hypothetical protein [Bacillota bacterium]
MEKLARIAEERREELFALPNVVGVAVGYKRRGGAVTDQPSVVVLVRKKVPLAQLAPDEVIPSEVEGVPTDVVEVGDLKALEALPEEPDPEAHRRKLRPARPGISIGHFRVTAGTLGAVVYDRESGEPLILSNNHVLANSQTPRGRRAAIGDPVYQPGPYDGGTAADTLATLHRYVPLRFPTRRPAAASRSAAPALNQVDAAVARPLSPELLRPEILGLGQLTGTAAAELEMPVRKSGRTTGCTNGKVTALHATLRVGYGEGRTATFVDQIVLEPMSQGGDSGSLVIDAAGRAVGLLFAGSPSATIASPIAAVLESLRVTFSAP